MPAAPRETRSPTDDARAADLQVLRRFCVPLPRYPGYVALYSLVQELAPAEADVASSGSAGALASRWIRWDGVRALWRIPPRYGSPPVSHSDACPRHRDP